MEVVPGLDKLDGLQRGNMVLKSTDNAPTQNYEHSFEIAFDKIP